MLKALANSVSSHPLLYQAIQMLLGQGRSIRELQKVLGEVDRGRALDIGSSAGALGRRLVSDAVRLDLDALPLLAMKRAHPEGRAVGGDAAELPFGDSVFDLSLCVAVSHHLDDRALDAALREISRVTRGRFVFLDALRSSRAVARLLWRYDRGSHPRSRPELIAALEKWFTIQSVVDYKVLHEYLICLATPSYARNETTASMTRR